MGPISRQGVRNINQPPCTCIENPGDGVQGSPLNSRFFSSHTEVLTVSESGSGKTVSVNSKFVRSLSNQYESSFLDTPSCCLICSGHTPLDSVDLPCFLPPLPPPLPTKHHRRWIYSREYCLSGAMGLRSERMDGHRHDHTRFRITIYRRGVYIYTCVHVLPPGYSLGETGFNGRF